MYKVIMSKDRTKAAIHYSNGQSISLSHDKGRVLELVLEVLKPLQTERGNNEQINDINSKCKDEKVIVSR